ncbi:acyltransferase [Fusarium mundagurra]|uniref:Acyltransferase n=1 Tax=Fusarium mundagurra TaxID=1567541 RepID=A0A8H5Y8L5_9HYPO|nr:acyltransferase [Fusarium mundagurra]
MNTSVDPTSPARHTTVGSPPRPSPRQPAREEHAPWRTLYLDGLRGFASLLVYIHHHVLWAHDSDYSTIERSFGYKQRYHFITLPLIRIIFNGGHFGTAIFFVLSGYVLSIKSLEFHNSSMQAPSRTVTKKCQLIDHIRSAIARRWFRLYLPLFFTTFAQMLVTVTQI